MPKFARPNSYNGKQSNQNWTGQTRAATAAEAAAGDSEQLYISPATLASAVGDLVPSATTVIEGVVLVTDNNSPVATKFYVDNIASLIVPVTAVVTGVDASPYAALGTDYVIAVDTGAGVMTITLPAAPETGRSYVVYDAGGAAAGSNITIDGNGNNIAAAGTVGGTKALNTAYESMTLYFDGTLWLGQNIV